MHRCDIPRRRNPTHQPVEVLWIMNQQWDAWEQKLPTDTRDQLERDRKGTNIQGINPEATKGINNHTVMYRGAVEGLFGERPDQVRQGEAPYHNLGGWAKAGCAG